MNGHGLGRWHGKPLKVIAAAVVALPLLAASGLAAAHHSFAMFDQSKVVTIEGSVVAFQWKNPHIYLHLQSKDSQAPAGLYVFEGGSVNMLSRNGWKPSSVKAGDKVTVVYHPLRDGQPGGALKSVQMPDGRVLKTW